MGSSPTPLASPSSTSTPSPAPPTPCMVVTTTARGRLRRLLLLPLCTPAILSLLATPMLTPTFSMEPTTGATMVSVGTMVTATMATAMLATTTVKQFGHIVQSYKLFTALERQ